MEEREFQEGSAGWSWGECDVAERGYGTWRCQGGSATKGGDRPDHRDPCCLILSAVGISCGRILGEKRVGHLF